MDKNITIYCIYSILWTRILQYIAYIVYYGQEYYNILHI